MSRKKLTAVSVAILLAGGLAGTAGAVTSGVSANSRLPLLDRSSQGEVDAFGGASRVRGDQTGVIKGSLKKGPAKNVIVIIGDGVGDSELTIGRNYLEGAGGSLAGLDALPVTGNMTTYSVDRETGKPDYVADSAATGTAWASGVKTYDNAVGIDRTGKAQATLLQRAKRAGMATGNVTTSEIQDATPAVQYAHISQRGCYGPTRTSTTCPEAAKENGGRGSISEQLLDTRPDVSLGGGSATFAEVAKAGRWQGRTLEQQAKQRGFRYLTDAEDLRYVRSADQREPVLGLFAPGNLPTKFAPLVATPGGAAGPATRCQAEPTFAQVPSLPAMTRKAISLLDSNKQGNRNGFFLQVESASIDKRSHGADLCGQIGETEQLDRAVSSALDFARKDGNTLVIVTGDHAHTGQIVDDATPGLNAKVRTADGSDMTVSYGTAAAGASQQHTGAQIRVAAYGKGAANVAGLIDQTDLFFLANRSISTR